MAPLLPDHPAPDIRHSIRGHSLITARWIALTGQTLAVLIAYYGLGFNFPVVPCLICIAATGLVNNYASIKQHHRGMSPHTSFLYLAFDILQLTTLLYLSGGMGNPFFVLLIAPVLIGAAILPKRNIPYLLGLGLICSGYLSLFYIPLEWPDMFLRDERMRKMTESLSINITMLFVSFYAWKISEESRAMQKAIFATQTALLKQKQLQALGAVAAAAVHELGSPLGTITIIAKELSNDLGKDERYAEDMATLTGQTERCKKILSDFGKTLKSDPTYMTTPLTPKSLIENIATSFLGERPDIEFSVKEDTVPERISIIQTPELSHSLGVYIQNAVQLTNSAVHVFISSGKNQKGLTISIEDNGPGFPEKILPHLGEPYTSSRTDSGKNMGLWGYLSPRPCWKRQEPIYPTTIKTPAARRSLSAGPTRHFSL